MTARTARLTVDPGNPAIHVEVLDTGYQVRASGYGRIEETLPTGLYTVRYAAADAVQKDDITLRPDMPLTLDKPPKLKFASPAPLNLTSTKHEWHQHPAHELSQNETKAFGSGAQLLLFVRDVNRKTDGCCATGLSLRHLDGAPVTPLTEVMKTNEADAWAGCNLALDPGTYRLRLDLGSDQAVETIVHLCLGWQSQVFLLREGGRLEARGRLIVDLPGAAQLMTRLGQGFDPWNKVHKRVDLMAAGEDLRLAELARLALDHGWRGFHSTDLNAMLDGKWEDPLLGIYGLHLLLLASEPDLALAERVLGRLRGILVGPPHPDIDALDLELAHRQGRSIELPPFAAPPMLRRSWAMLVAATARQPSLVQPGSLAMRIADRLWGDGAWLVWTVPEEEADEPGHLERPLLARKGRRDDARLVQRELAMLDFDRLKALIEEFCLDQVFETLGIDEAMAQANLDGAEAGLLTYLQRFLPSRRARYGARSRDTLALGVLVEQLGLPAAKVKSVAAGLVLKAAMLRARDKVLKAALLRDRDKVLLQKPPEHGKRHWVGEVGSNDDRREHAEGSLRASPDQVRSVLLMMSTAIPPHSLRQMLQPTSRASLDKWWRAARDQTLRDQTDAASKGRD